MPDLNRSLLSEGENADTLGGLSGVSITSPEEFQTLGYNGTEWVNSYSPTVSYVRNAEANTLTTGTVVYLFGGTGDHATVKRADYGSDTTSSKTIGLVAASIAATENGPVVTRGYVDGIDLSTGFAEGDVLWLGANGQFTKTKTVAPNHLVFIGVVVRATNNGIVYVATQNGYELDELHNVAIANTLASGDFLKYNGTLWVNDQIDLGTDTTGNYIATIAGTANEITVSGSGSENAAVTISLPANVTISNNLIVTGDLTVSGNTTTINTANLNVEDSFILLNSGETSSPTLNSGIEIERGTSTNVFIRWNETSDKWQFTNDGTNYTDLGAGGATISDTAPTSPVAGQVWFESDTAATYVYYDSHWIEIGASGTAAYVGDTAPSNPIPGQFWYDSSDGGTYVYYDSVWVEVGALAINSLLSIINAKGDLLVGTADNTLDRLAVGTNGYFLKANSSTTTGLEWASIPTINALDDIGDVSVSGVSSGQVLQWNGSAWVGATVSSDVMTDTRNAALIIMDIGA
jgi:hypothetical protein